MRDLLDEELKQVYGAAGKGSKPHFSKAHVSRGHWTGKGKKRYYEKAHYSKAHFSKGGGASK